MSRVCLDSDLAHSAILRMRKTVTDIELSKKQRVLGDKTSNSASSRIEQKLLAPKWKL